MRKILSNKLYLYLTEFFAGMSVMAVELGASRLLAPYFSSSQIVYTIIIGTVMIAMALGNIYGGRKADKDPDPDKLYRRILIAAIWIAAIPVVGKYIILGISGLVIFTVNTNFLVIAAFVSAMVVFVFPLFLLGTVTPSLAAYTIENRSDSGKVVGRLGACNTIGSIIGTFLPTFVTIPSVGTAITFLIFAGILIVLCIIYFISGRNDPKDPDQENTEGKDTKKPDTARIIAGILVFIFCCAFGSSDSFAFWEDDLTYEGESIYNYLQVKEDDSQVILSTNVLFGVQSLYQKNGALTGMYYDTAMAAPMMAGIGGSEPFRILILGNGSGTFATQCMRYYGSYAGPIQIDAVEIDQDITDLAEEFFHLSPDVNVVTYDGRAFLDSVDEKYHVIMVDAYQDITIPFQMASTEFFTLVKDHLYENGVMVVNLNMRGGGKNAMNTYLADTISTCFSEVWTADVDWSFNRELFASNSPYMLDTFRKGYAAAKSASPAEAKELGAYLQSVDEKLQKYVPGNNVMTDDKAPVELLSMRAIDEIIYDEVAYLKDIYKEKGIKGVIDALQ
ncbi:MAG: fused MFS/spermidine synthase [Firmicutes bacterium]|nr:fused MFS/spermidine synthase [Bacillota bacterium]